MYIYMQNGKEYVYTRSEERERGKDGRREKEGGEGQGGVEGMEVKEDDNEQEGAV